MGESQAKDIWAAVLGGLQVQVPRSTYDTWLKDTVGLSLDNDVIVVGVPSPFTIEWLEKRMYHLVHKTVRKVTHRPIEIEFQIADPYSKEIQDSQPPLDQDHSSNGRSQQTPSFLNRRYSFDSFVVGPCNSLAFNAAQAVATAPGHSYNPLFLYSSTGLGKTHLLHSIARSCIEQKIKCLYVTSEQFTNEFISAIRERSTEDFRAKYRSTQLLLMDDIQFMGGKEQTQVGFFHIFNDLHNASRQLVITSDRSPKTMPLLENRLRSRFGWGLIAKIQPPSLETRIAILQTKAREMKASVNGEVIEYIATRIHHDNVRDLEGTLNGIVALAQLTNSPITRQLASQAMQNILQDSSHRPQSPDCVLRAVKRVFNVEHDALIGHRRHKELTTARQVAMYLMHEQLGMPITQIGHFMGGKNHSTVIHAVKNITSQLNMNSPLQSRILAVKEELLNTSNRA